MTKNSRNPRLLPLLRLRCPYCGKTPLRKGGSWFVFASGCPTCDYMFEREVGYYAGASWLVNFPVVSLSGFVLAGLLVAFAKTLSSEMIAVIACCYMLLFGAWFTPYSMAIWMFGEHLLHPLNADDQYSKSRLSEPNQSDTP
jgi:hypothetical protein